jgi:hypothetical protein
MERVLTVPVGVVIAHDKIDQPWQECLWRPVSVILNPPPFSGWRELMRAANTVHYHAATLALELHHKETSGYLFNLLEGGPSVYVVLRERDASDDIPVDVHLVTASPHEAQAYGHSPEEIVGAVAMPQPLIALLQAFVEAHHEDEPFIKRQRAKHHRSEEHKFGQEPIAELRRRMQQAANKKPTE